MQMPSVVNLYVTNINQFLVKFKKIRVVLKQRVVFRQMRCFLDDVELLKKPIVRAAGGKLTTAVFRRPLKLPDPRPPMVNPPIFD